MTFRFDVITLFEELMAGYLAGSILGRAQAAGLVEITFTNPRDFTEDRHRTVDDAPFGGGAGMVMRPDVVDAAIGAALAGVQARCGSADVPLVYLTPRGRRLDQARVKALSDGPGVIILCGRYEGVDERVLEARDVEEISLGDFVLSGGEPAALALIDACVRLLPGVMGSDQSLAEESFESGLLEYPHYTRPQDWQGRTVPDVLVSGHHERVRDWRRQQAEKITQARRPDLWARLAGEKE